MRFQTIEGKFVTAATKTEAAALAAQYGFGELICSAPAPNDKPAKPMTTAQAFRLQSQANEWPRMGDGWPKGAREREASRLISEADEEEQ